MIWRIEIEHKKSVFDAFSVGVEKDIKDLGINTVKKVQVAQIYNIEGDLTQTQADIICRELLTNNITQEYSLIPADKYNPPLQKENIHVVEIAYNPGVMDPCEQSTIKGIEDLGLNVKSVRTAKEYIIEGALNDQQLNLIVDKVLANKLIQHVVKHGISAKHLEKSHQESFNLLKVNLLNSNDKELMKLSKEGQLFLNLDEMKNIQKYFKGLKREPTDCELETIAQTWSEHCYHKTFKGTITFRYKENGKQKKQVIKNLLKSTIVKATYEINKPWCVSVFHDNAGVIKFDEDSNVCFKVETHNHPSALEPFGGANTGVGGVIRDVLGTGLGAKPICNTDIFCFAPPETSFDNLPAGTLHPKRVMKGVVSGVRDYGNKMGIPTVNGAILFDERFIGNPLVFCGNVGIMPKDKVKKQAKKGDLIVALGGKTGRDGIHGATFSSGELTDESETVSSGAVQIGNPIQEKKVLDALIQARDKNLYNAITDCGAGGFSSAIGEMGEQIGARVELDKAPLKYKGLKYTEIWISESQERMIMAVPTENIDELIKICESENVEATVLGTFSGSGRLELFYKGNKVCDLDMEFLHKGNLNIKKDAFWSAPKAVKPRLPKEIDLNKKLLSVLSHYNVCSKEWVIRQYDHEVQGGSIIKPLVGKSFDGPSDASVILPKEDKTKGVAVSNGINVMYGKLDPFWMAASCIDEAIRQIISVGGNLDKIAILDNFCWGNPDKPDRLGGLVRAAIGCYKTSLGFKVPFISGKDSLYNEFTLNNKSIAIPGTILISAIGIIDDVRKCLTMDFKAPGNLIYILGNTYDELGGSVYLDTFGTLGVNVPKVDVKSAVKIYSALSKAVQKELVASIHDCSEGGFAVAVSEMAFAGGFGATIDLRQVPFKGKEKRDDVILFSESNSRFIVEVNPKKQKQFEATLKGLTFSVVGQVEAATTFKVVGIDNKDSINQDIRELKESWQKTLRW